jgi:shikimate dehydrogenase
VKLAVIGDPVGQSRSPRLHRDFLNDSGIDGSYVAIQVPRGNAIDVVRRMRLDGYTGCNVTSPLKEEAVGACDQVDESAKRIGAVNTLFLGMAIVGTNTDGLGARIALETLLDEPIALKRVGVLGAGATARAILSQLQDNDVYTFVWARDEKKVEDVCERFGAQRWPSENPPEIVVSALPPDVAFAEEFIEQLQVADLVMDSNYGSRSTLGLALRRDVVTGEAMLEAQARASFDFWLAHVEGLS